MLKSRSMTLLTLLTVTMFVTCRAALSDDWPQWRGPNRDAKSLETGLLREWPADGPPVAWQVENAGVGYSSLVVSNGRVITQGDLNGVEHIMAFSEKDGSLLWAVQPEPVSHALKQRVDSQFSRFDKNGDGRLDELEALSGLGWTFNRFDGPVEGDRTAIANKRVSLLFGQIDQNKDGKLSFSEIPGAMQRELGRIDAEDKAADRNALAESRTKALFTLADKDGDRQVSQREARGTVLARLFNRADQRIAGTNRGDGQLTVEELKTYFLAREPGRDGEISATELEEFYARQFPGQDGVLVKSDLHRFYGGYRNRRGDGPRGTPTVDGNFVYAEGGNGDLTCLDVATGKTIWHVNLVSDLGGGRPGWGYSESPLIVGDVVIVTPGGKKGTVAALNKKDGKMVWRSSEVTDAAHYASPVVAEIAGVKQIVQFARQSLFGITLDGGQRLWSYSGANNGTANCSSPIVAADFVLASSGYGTGTGVVKISGSSSSPRQQEAEEVYFQKRLANHHGGLVKLGEHVYGFGAGLVCMNFHTGEFAWQSRSVGKGSLVYADGMLYCLGERNQVALVDATPDGYRERGRFSIENLGLPSWAHPVVANGRFYIRNQHRLTAYDIKAER